MRTVSNRSEKKNIFHESELGTNILYQKYLDIKMCVNSPSAHFKA